MTGNCKLVTGNSPRGGDGSPRFSAVSIITYCVPRILAAASRVRRAGRCRCGHKCGNKYLHRYGQEHLHQYGQKCLDQYGQKCLDQYGQKYLDQYGQRYSGRYGQGYFDQYDERCLDQYGQKYSGQCGQRYSGRYGQKCLGQYGVKHGGECCPHAVVNLPNQELTGRSITACAPSRPGSSAYKVVGFRGFPDGSYSTCYGRMTPSIRSGLGVRDHNFAAHPSAPRPPTPWPLPIQRETS